MAWHGKVQQTILQVKWSSICNELRIDETPHLIIQGMKMTTIKLDTLSTLLFIYTTRLNVVKHGKR